MLYRYFQPHFNPRLRLVPVRLQELAELEQAAVELRRAIQRTSVRNELEPFSAASNESFSKILDAMDFVVKNLGELIESHPGDNDETLRRLLEERKELPGWDAWVKLVSERLSHLNTAPNDEKGANETITDN